MTGRIEAWLGSDGATRIMGWVTVALVFSTLLLAVLFIPTIASNTEASQRTDEIAGCRATYRAKIDDANFAVSLAVGEAQSGLSDAVVLSIRDDPKSLSDVAAAIEVAEVHKDDAYLRLKIANDAYVDAVELSRSNPDEFLRRCAG